MAKLTVNTISKQLIGSHVFAIIKPHCHEESGGLPMHTPVAANNPYKRTTTKLTKIHEPECRNSSYVKIATQLLSSTLP